MVMWLVAPAYAWWKGIGADPDRDRSWLWVLLLPLALVPLVLAAGAARDLPAWTKAVEGLVRLALTPVVLAYQIVARALDAALRTAGVK